MNRVAIVTSLVAVFLIGVSLGLVCGIAFTHRGPLGVLGMGAGMRQGGRGPRPPISQVLPRLARELDLTPEQLERIKPRVQASQREFEAARESLKARIEAELTPGQRVRWRAMEEQRARARRFPGEPRGDFDRMHRAPPPGPEGEPR